MLFLLINFILYFYKYVLVVFLEKKGIKKKCSDICIGCDNVNRFVIFCRCNYIYVYICYGNLIIDI